jgi:Zn-dependent M28 family amino/carboxypeptidase
MKRPLFLVAAMLLVFAVAPATSAAVPGCDTRVNNTYQTLLECVTLDGARAHQAAFQEHADANNGIRTSGSPGYDASADYVAETMEAAGYDVTVQEFQFQTFIVLSPTILEQVSPSPAGPIANSIMSYSGSGDVTAAVTALAAPPADGTPGCEASDFAGFTAGNIALIRRGTCTFAIKATNAYNAGASGVVIYNNQPGVINGTLGADFTLNIGVTSVTAAVGEQLAATSGLVLRLKTDTFRGIATTSNVFAETPGGDPNNVVMVGAHLDSVNAGPGIQDNGSGSAAILEVAEALANVPVRNKVRFAWWGAEESGLVGSRFYVNNLPQSERDKIALYLNFDMIGSPNYVFFVYDGDDSDGVGAPAGPPGSAAIEKLFESFYSRLGHSWKGTDFSGRSDYGPFIAAGVDIPSGGLFTGAEGLKTADEVAIWGGTAGQQYDPCYHQACDTYDNINLEAFDVNVDAVAFATLTYAYSTKDVNGGKGNVPSAPSWGTATLGQGYPGGSQGGLHDDHDLAVE